MVITTRARHLGPARRLAGGVAVALAAVWVAGGAAAQGLPGAHAESANLAPAAPVTARLAGIPRAVVPSTFGLNAQNVAGPALSNTAFVRALGSFGPGNLRYPGGTVANFWDWRTGWYQPGGPWPGQPDTKAGTTLGTFAAAARQVRAGAVLDVNLTTWRGRLATDADVPAMIDDTLAFLRAAQRAGVAVRRVELGNEFYLRGPNPGTTHYQQRFPSAAGYAAVANRFAAAIHARFPTAEVAAVGAVTDHIPGISTRRATWNAELLPHLRSVDAITLHLNVRVPDATSSPAEVIGLMTRQIDALEANQLPALAEQGLTVWVTEYCMADITTGGAFRGRWVQGLAAGTLAVRLLGNPAVTQLSLHNMAGDAGVGALFRDSSGFGESGPATTPFALTANGAVLQLVQEALRGATRAQPLAFPDGPALGAQGAPGLLGLLATGPTSRRVVVLNLTGTSHTVDLTAVVPGAFGYRTARARTVMSRIAGPGDVVRSSGTATGPVTLRPWSVTLLTG